MFRMKSVKNWWCTYVATFFCKYLDLSSKQWFPTTASNDVIIAFRVWKQSNIFEAENNFKNGSQRDCCVCRGLRQALQLLQIDASLIPLPTSFCISPINENGSPAESSTGIINNLIYSWHCLTFESIYFQFYSFLGPKGPHIDQTCACVGW